MRMSSSSSSSSIVRSAAFHTEIAVIGAGVVGLAIARSLAMAGKEVLILERASTICSETSSRNSEVIHAGLYYPKSSWKANFCVDGKQLIYEFCKTHNVPYKNCGKLIVATTKEQFRQNLHQLQHTAESNGVLDTKIITSDDVKYLEPNVYSEGALLSPSTGVFDSHTFCLGLLGDAESYGAILALNTTVDDATIISNNNNNNSQDNNTLLLHADDTWIKCDAIVNSAGLSANKIAEMIHNSSSSHNTATNNISSSWKPPKQYYAKGTYFRLQGGIQSPFEHLIYPIPDEHGGLGIHATIDWTNQITKFGPDVEWVDPQTVQNTDDISLEADYRRGYQFYNKIRRYWPDLPDNSILPDYVGIRPKLVHPQIVTNESQNNITSASAAAGGGGSGSINKSDSSLLDFNILGPEVHGITGLIHLMGIESPGLTSSMAIADYVRDMVLMKK